MLLHQLGHFLPETKAVNVAANGGAIRMDNLLAVNFLLFKPNACRSQGAYSHRVVHNLVVSGLGRGEVLSQMRVRPTQDL